MLSTPVRSLHPCAESRARIATHQSRRGAVLLPDRSLNPPPRIHHRPARGQAGPSAPERAASEWIQARKASTVGRLAWRAG